MYWDLSRFKQWRLSFNRFVLIFPHSYSANTIIRVVVLISVLILFVKNNHKCNWGKATSSVLRLDKKLLQILTSDYENIFKGSFCLSFSQTIKTTLNWKINTIHHHDDCGEVWCKQSLHYLHLYPAGITPLLRKLVFVCLGTVCTTFHYFHSIDIVILYQYNVCHLYLLFTISISDVMSHPCSMADIWFYGKKKRYLHLHLLRRCLQLKQPTCMDAIWLSAWKRK